MIRKNKDSYAENIENFIILKCIESLTKAYNIRQRTIEDGKKKPRFLTRGLKVRSDDSKDKVETSGIERNEDFKEGYVGTRGNNIASTAESGSSDEIKMRVFEINSKLNKNDSQEEKKKSTLLNTLRVSERYRTVFLDNLSLEVEENFIREIFKDCGYIEQVKLHTLKKYYGKSVRRRLKRKLMKVASITFSTLSAAQKAVDKNPIWINDNYVNIQFFDDTHIDIGTFINNRIFLLNVSHTVTKEKLCQFFEDCGEPLYIRYLHNVTEEFTGIIYIQFRTYEAVRRALQKDGQYLNGECLTMTQDLIPDSNIKLQVENKSIIQLMKRLNINSEEESTAYKIGNRNLAQVFTTSFQGLKASIKKQRTNRYQKRLDGKLNSCRLLLEGHEKHRFERHRVLPSWDCSVAGEMEKSNKKWKKLL